MGSRADDQRALTRLKAGGDLRRPMFLAIPEPDAQFGAGLARVQKTRR